MSVEIDEQSHSGQAISGEKIEISATMTTRSVPVVQGSATSRAQHEGNIEKTESQKLSRPVWTAVVLATLSSTFLFALDNTVVADVQPRIVESLDDIQRLPWISVAFALGAISVNLLWGKLYGIFNNKPVFITSIFIFEIGSAICGAAPTMNAMITGRATAGVGGGGIYIGAINILTASTPITQRPLYMSLVGATWSAGTILGPIVGGAFAESTATWRWAFYINLCVAFICAPIYVLFLPSRGLKVGIPIRERVRSLDFLGIILFTGASVTLIMAIAFGGAVYDWNSGQIIALFVSTGLFWISFCLQQSMPFLTNSDNQIFPIHFLRSLQMCLLFAQTGICIACIFIPVYFIPLFFQFVRDDSALEAGIRLLPFVFVAVVGAMVNGIIMERYGWYMPWFLAGGLLITIGGALLHTVTLHSSAARVYGYSVIVALGTGFFVQAPFSVAQAKVAHNLVSEATAFISCGQITGIVLSLAIANTVFVNEASNKIQALLPNAPRSAIQGGIAGVGTHLFKTQGSDIQAKILDSIVVTIGNIYVMVILGGALAVVLSVFMKRERLFLKTETSEETVNE